MADIEDPFTPGQTKQPDAGVGQEFGKLKQEWDTFLQNPQGRAALLSAGIAMMQPPSFGDTTMSMLGRAIGAAGQSATATQAMDLKEQEALSKQDLRASQAGLAEARAATAGERSGREADRLQYLRDKLAQDNSLRRLGSRIRAVSDYNREKKALAEQNAKEELLWDTRKGPFVPKVMPDMEEYLRSRGINLEDDTAIPANVPTTTSGSSRRTPSPEAIAYLKANPATRAQFDQWYGTGSAAAALGE